MFGFLLSKFTFRQCAFVGGLLMAAGMSASSLAQNPLQLFFAYGLAAGMDALQLFQYFLFL